MAYRNNRNSQFNARNGFAKSANRPVVNWDANYVMDGVTYHFIHVGSQGSIEYSAVFNGDKLTLTRVQDGVTAELDATSTAREGWPLVQGFRTALSNAIQTEYVGGRPYGGSKFMQNGYVTLTPQGRIEAFNYLMNFKPVVTGSNLLNL